MINKKPLSAIENSGENGGIIADTAIFNAPVTIMGNIEKKRAHSLIPHLIEILSELTNLPEKELDKAYKISLEQIKEYDISEKIEYNYILEYKDIINEYSQYCTICEEAFNIIDNNNIGTKNRLLRSINLLYKQYKGKLLKRYKSSGMDEISIIRENSDEIIDYIKLELEQRILDDYLVSNILKEDIEVGLVRIICYAFVECKILEKPRG